MKALPGIVKNLFSEGLVYMILIMVLIIGLDSNSSIVNLKAIMGPKRIVECEGTFCACYLVMQNSLWSFLQGNTNLRVNEIFTMETQH